MIFLPLCGRHALIKENKQIANDRSNRRNTIRAANLEDWKQLASRPKK